MDISENDCPICMESYSDDTKTELSCCRQNIHKECLNKCKPLSDGFYHCPFCRAKITRVREESPNISFSLSSLWNTQRRLRRNPTIDLIDRAIMMAIRAENFYEDADCEIEFLEQLREEAQTRRLDYNEKNAILQAMQRCSF